MKQILKALLLILLAVIIIELTESKAQDTLLFSKNDIPVMSLMFGAGYLVGWREEVLYHPNALFKHFPNLNKNYWDNRRYKRHNANHHLKTAYTSMFIAAAVIKIGDKKKWYYYLIDGVKYVIAYKAGFYASYNLTHKNKFTW